VVILCVCVWASLFLVRPPRERNKNMIYFSQWLMALSYSNILKRDVQRVRELISRRCRPTGRPAAESEDSDSALCVRRLGSKVKGWRITRRSCKSVCARIHSDLVRCGGGERGVTACIILVINFAHSEEIKTRQHNF
jgi:hypothetical protein